KVDGFETNLAATRSELIARADRTDDKLYGVQRQVEDVDGRISGLEERLSALEAARKRPTASVSAPKPKAKPASRPAKADDDEVKPAKSHGKVVTEEPQSQNVIAGYKLRGVSRGAAIVE